MYFLHHCLLTFDRHPTRKIHCRTNLGISVIPVNSIGISVIPVTCKFTTRSSCTSSSDEPILLELDESPFYMEMKIWNVSCISLFALSVFAIAVTGLAGTYTKSTVLLRKVLKLV